MIDLLAFSQFEGMLVFKEGKAFVLNDIVKGEIPFVLGDEMLEGEVSVETLTEFLHLNSRGITFSMDKNRKNLILKTETGAKIYIPFKVESDSPDFPEWMDVSQSLKLDWEDFISGISVITNLKNFGTVSTNLPEAMGLVIEGKMLYGTDLSSMVSYGEVNFSEPVKSRLVLPKTALKILQQWGEMFGAAISLTIYKNNLVQFEWENGAVLLIQAPFIMKPLPIKEVLETVRQEKTLSPIHDDWKNAFKEIQSLGKKASLNKNILYLKEENKFVYSKEFETPYSIESVTLTNLGEISKFNSLCNQMTLPISDKSELCSDDQKIRYIFSTK